MVFNDFTSQTVYYTNDETFSRFIVQIIQIKGRFVIYKDEWVGKKYYLSLIFLKLAQRARVFLWPVQDFWSNCPDALANFWLFCAKICRQLPETSAPNDVYFPNFQAYITKLQRHRLPASGQDTYFCQV